MNRKVVEAINDQIKNELFSGYLYLSMSAWFETQNLHGMAKWMKMQAGEEQEHAMKFFKYLNERGAAVVLKAIDSPQVEFESALQIFEMALKHEEFITAKINSLYELAVAENDYPTQILLQWYINEQVEEEDNAHTAVDMLKMTDGKAYQLLMLDSKFGARA